jgi:UDP-N-acetyl-D-glucosamine dehydrogenase
MRLAMPPALDELLSRIRSRRAIVAVVGLGYVGLPTVRAFHDAGFTVIGFDVDSAKIAMLREGRAYLKHLGEGWIKDLAASDRFRPTDRARDLAEADAVILCVPTPLGAHREPDLSFVERSTGTVAEHLRRGQLVVLTSTSYPGTTREVCLPLLTRGGLACGTDFFLAFSPEREDPGREGLMSHQIPRLVGGIDRPSLGACLALFGEAIRTVIPVESAEIAESAKLLENIYRAVNIALVNELKPVLASMAIDIWKVIDAAATKPFGFQPFYPGPGLGGHCIPIDPFYLTWKAHEFGHETRFIELAGEINSAMPRYVVERVAAALNDEGKALKGADVLVIGLAYKPNVDDVRETPAAEVITLLLERGARVSYHDPHVPRFPRMRNYDVELESEPLTRDRLSRSDCALIVTNHDAVEWNLIARAAKLVVDTRNALGGIPNPAARIVKA